MSLTSEFRWPRRGTLRPQHPQRSSVAAWRLRPYSAHPSCRCCLRWRSLIVMVRFRRWFDGFLTVDIDTVRSSHLDNLSHSAPWCGCVRSVHGQGECDGRASKPGPQRSLLQRGVCRVSSPPLRRSEGERDVGCRDWLTHVWLPCPHVGRSTFSNNW